MNENRKGKLKRWHKVLIITVSVIVVLCLIAVLGINSLLNRINKAEDKEFEPVSPENEYFETDDNAEELREVAPENVTWPEIVDPIDGGDITNILLIGQDRREGESRARSDSMIIVSINNNTEEVSLISLMRDTYVQIPGYSDNRINTAYAFGGMELLDKTIYQNFGVEIDANIEVDFDAFVSVIDAIGGVEVNISEDEAKYLNGSFIWSTGREELSSGIVHMDGELALFYSRIRSLEGSDFARTERQRKVLSAMINKARNSDIDTILDFVNAIVPLVTTDLTNAEIVTYAITYFPLLADSSINMYRIPNDGDFYDASIRGMSVLVPDLEACRETLEEIMS